MFFEEQTKKTAIDEIDNSLRIREGMQNPDVFINQFMSNIYFLLFKAFIAINEWQLN